MRRWIFLLGMLVVLLSSCGGRDRATPPGPEVDQAVIAAALDDFAHWNEVTFGELEGALEVEEISNASPDATAEGIRSLAPNIRDQLSEELVGAFIHRNRSAVPVASVVAESSSARIREPGSNDRLPFDLPQGTKATGSLTLPGFSADGSRALVQVHHSWSIHGAVVTYVLSNTEGTWKVVARDQIVFL